MSSMTIVNLGTRVASNYPISSEAGWILIDTGHAGDFLCNIKQLRKRVIDPKEIRYAP